MFFLDKWIHNNSLINVQPEENCRIDEKGSNLGKMIGPNFRNWSEFRTIGPNAERLVRIPNDWSECRMIGLNAERLVRIPNDWSEFQTIGPNAERLVRIPNDWSEFRTIDELDVGVFKNRKKTVESVELLCCSDVEVLVCKAIWKCLSGDGRKNRRGLT